MPQEKATPLVSEVQETILRQQAALCHFRAQGITVHEVMIVGSLIEQYATQAKANAQAFLSDLDALLKGQGFKGQQKARMLSAARMYVERGNR